MGAIVLNSFKRISYISIVLRGNIWFKKYSIFKNQIVKRRWNDRKKYEIYKWINGNLLKNGFKLIKLRKNRRNVNSIVKKRW